MRRRVAFGSGLATLDRRRVQLVRVQALRRHRGKRRRLAPGRTGRRHRQLPRDCCRSRHGRARDTDWRLPRRAGASLPSSSGNTRPNQRAGPTRLARTLEDVDVGVASCSAASPSSRRPRRIVGRRLGGACRSPRWCGSPRPSGTARWSPRVSPGARPSTICTRSSSPDHAHPHLARVEVARRPRRRTRSAACRCRSPPRAAPGSRRPAGGSRCPPWRTCPGFSSKSGLSSVVRTVSVRVMWSTWG